MRTAVRTTAGRSVESVYASLGCQLQCGQCACYAQELIDAEQCALVPAE